MTSTTASFTKLRSGDWGVRVPTESVSVGEAITVTKSDGSQQSVTVDAVIWRGNGMAICAIRSERRATAAARSSRPKSYGLGRRTGCSCGSREHGTQASDCWQCRHDAE